MYCLTFFSDQRKFWVLYKLRQDNTLQLFFEMDPLGDWAILWLRSWWITAKVISIVVGVYSTLVGIC